MKSRAVYTIVGLLAAAFFQDLSITVAAGSGGNTDRPNIVIIYIDDMGYADIGPFGAKGYATPHLDRMVIDMVCHGDHKRS